MPIGDIGIENVYMMDASGNVIGKIVNAETVTMAVTDDDVEPIIIPRSFSFTAKWKADRTNRKTFCRELIKIGFTKKEAKAIARMVKGRYGQYLSEIRIFGKENFKSVMGIG